MSIIAYSQWLWAGRLGGNLRTALFSPTCCNWHERWPYCHWVSELFPFWKEFVSRFPWLVLSDQAGSVGLGSRSHWSGCLVVQEFKSKWRPLFKYQHDCVLQSVTVTSATVILNLFGELDRLHIFWSVGPNSGQKLVVSFLALNLVLFLPLARVCLTGVWNRWLF